MSADLREDAYSSAKVKRSLVHFLVGKTGSAIIAIGMLLVLVRMLERESYGLYIVLLATLELVQLGSSLGCYPALNRYVPELLSRNQGLAVRRLLWLLSCWRGVTLGVACIIFAGMARPLSGLLGFPDFAAIIALYAVVIFLEGAARYFDVIFETLLLQGVSQSAVLLRNGLRLAGIVLAFSFDMQFSLLIFVWMEITASACGLGFSILLTVRHVNTIARTRPGDHAMPSMSRMRGYVTPAYLAQVVGLAQGPDLVKMLVAKLSGAVQTGAFGFAAALASMLQRYLPVFLLIGMVRPLFVSQQARGRDPARLILLANLVFKLNVFVIAPVTMLLLVVGERLTGILSGGKFPEAWQYLAALLLLLVAQTLHVVLGLIALAAEEARAGLVGTMYGLAGIAIGLLLYPSMGPLSMCAGLIVSELIWCWVMQAALKRHGFHFRIDWSGLLRLWLAASVAMLPLMLGRAYLLGSSLLALLSAIAFTALLYLFIARLLRPFSGSERHLINSALPKPIFVW